MEFCKGTHHGRTFNQATVMIRVTYALLFFLAAFPALAQNVTTLIDEGIALHDKGEYDQAIAKYLQALAIEPDNGTAYYEASFSYHLKKDYENGLKMAEKAIEYATDRTKVLAIAVKGSILDDSGRRKESAEWYEKAFKQYPNEYLLLFNYGVTLAGLNQEKEAESAFIQALSNRFNHPGSHLQLANLEKRENAKAKAALGYSFFLLLENTSDRALGAAKSLYELYYPVKDSADVNTIYLTLPAKGDESWSAPELFFNLISTVSNEKNRAAGKIPSEQEQFASDTESFFKMVSETPKKKKKKAQRQSDFWWDNYVPFFTSMLEAGHTEAFCYHIMKGRNPEAFDTWSKENKDQLDRFYLWLKTR